jgi:hypothetical protein
MRRSDDALLRVQASLTNRDLVLLDWLYDHAVLTTDQIATALFPSLDFAHRRLLRLTQLGVLDRFRPQRWEGGSHPYHYLLGQLGYDIVAGQRLEDMPRRDHARRRRAHLTSRANLPHRLGINQFFVDLARHARVHADASLAWLSTAPYRTASGFLHSRQDNPQLVIIKGVPRPDGWGTWTEAGRTVPFFVEWDSGDESLDVLVHKVAGYDTAAVFTQWRWPVLFVLPSLRRETNLHLELDDWNAPGPTPVATVARDFLTATGHGPAEAVWRLRGHDGPRLRLGELPFTDDDPDTFDATRPDN